MKLSLEELTAYLKEYEKVRQVKVLDQINQMKQEEIQTKLEALSPVSACPSCNSNNFVKMAPAMVCKDTTAKTVRPLFP